MEWMKLVLEGNDGQASCLIVELVWCVDNKMLGKIVKPGQSLFALHLRL